jgi:hypothetical protein
MRWWEGKTPVLSSEEARRLLDSIEARRSRACVIGR